MMLALYRMATALLGPFARWHLSRRLARGKEDRQRFGERLGRAGRARPEGRLVWIHAASVGESLSILPLVERIPAATSRPTRVLVTTGTVTSARLMGERLGPDAFHQYAPVDLPDAARAFLDHWRPDAALWVESEFWPNLLSEVFARDIPSALIQGRVSDRSFAGWQWAPGMIRALLQGFSLSLGQTAEDARRLNQLGARAARCVGNLKFAAPPLPADASELARLRAAIGDRPVWFAASTHPGEEAIVAKVHLALRGRHPGLLTVIAPRHPERGEGVARELGALGVRCARRSAGALPEPDVDVYLADTLGELGLFYRLARLAFVGKSLAGEGGQNPVEAARLGCPILFGPRTSNFAEIAERLRTAGAAVGVADAAELESVLDRLLGDRDTLARMTRAGEAVADAEAGALDAVMAALRPLLGDKSDARA
ncbi:MAG: 3-deoxy-D-manno-octulosonic acid transferase [Rhodospirillales bacterium]|nr:3-deoxy-D-manno-octulosonic acid transferase [Rhodospirillales bacterium]